MEILPQDMSVWIRERVRQSKDHTFVTNPQTKLFCFQLFRALFYLHEVLNICHRDIKPHNILINPINGNLKICDFGRYFLCESSAKSLSPQEQNVAYICSRYYRAPELIFGAVNYENSIGLMNINFRYLVPWMRDW